MIKKSGFTLVELLVVMAIMAIFGTLTLTIFTNTLKGSNKSQVIGVIKQNGQAVLETMDKTIRNSDNVVCPFITPPTTTASSDILVVVKNGIYTRYKFIDTINSPATNGLIQQDSPAKQNVQNSNPPRQETDADLVNRVCLGSYEKVEPVIILTDTNPQSGVSVEKGLFTREKSAGFMDQVTIDFNIKPGVGAPASVTGQIDPVNFKTTIQLR